MKHISSGMVYTPFFTYSFCPLPTHPVGLPTFGNCISFLPSIVLHTALSCFDRGSGLGTQRGRRNSQHMFLTQSGCIENIYSRMCTSGPGVFHSRPKSLFAHSKQSHHIDSVELWPTRVPSLWQQMSISTSYLYGSWKGVRIEIDDDRWKA